MHYERCRLRFRYDWRKRFSADERSDIRDHVRRISLRF